MKNPDPIKYLPDNFTEEDKINYEIYIEEAKRYFKNIDEYIIHIGVISYINEQKGLGRECTDEEVKQCMDKYDLTKTNIVIETPLDENFKIEDTLKPIIYTETISTSNLENNLLLN